MVQEKEAARLRIQRRNDFLKKKREETERNTIRFRWGVNEHTPGYNTGGYYDQDIPAENHIVSPWFETKEEAVVWMERHEPDKGKTLNVVRHRLLRRTWTEWVTY